MDKTYKALTLALDALEQHYLEDSYSSQGKAITAIREALAQPEQEPVACKTLCELCVKRGYSFCVNAAQTTPIPSPPASKPWVGLTDEEKDAARWRFLVDNSFDKEGVTQFHVWEHSWEPHSQTGEPTEWKQRVRGPALERVIDAAIEAAHGIKGEQHG